MNCYNTQVFKDIRDTYGADIAYGVLEELQIRGIDVDNLKYVKDIDGTSDLDFSTITDENSGISLNVSNLIQAVQLKYGGENFENGLRRKIDSLRTNFPEVAEFFMNNLPNEFIEVDPQLIESRDPTQYYQNIILQAIMRVDPKLFDTLNDYQRAIIVEALAAFIRNPESTTIIDSAKTRIKDLPPHSGQSFIREVITKPSLQSKVKQLPGGGLWEVVLAEISKQTGMTEAAIESIISYKDVLQDVFTPIETPLSIRMKAVKEIRVSLENIVSKAIREGRPKKEIDKYNRALEELNQVTDQEAIVIGIRMAVSELDRLNRLFVDKTNDKSMDLETLSMIDDYASNYESYLKHISQMIKRSDSLTQFLGEDILNAVNQSIGIASDLQKEFVESAIPIMTTILAPFETQPIFVTRDNLAKKFNKENDRKDFTTRAEFEEAKRNYITSEMERLSDDILRRQREMISSKLRINTNGDKSLLRTFFIAIQNVGDDVLAMAKSKVDMSWRNIRLEYLEYEKNLNDLYEEFFNHMGGEPNPKVLYRNLIEKGLNGNQVNYLVSRFRMADFNRELNATRRRMADTEDSYERSQIWKEFYLNNIEREFTQEYYDFVDSYFGENTKESHYIGEDIKQFLYQFYNENGEFDPSLMEDSDFQVLEALNNKKSEFMNKKDLTAEEWEMFREHVEFVPNEMFLEMDRIKKETLSEEEYKTWYASRLDEYGNLKRGYARPVPISESWYNENFDVTDPLRPKASKYHNEQYDYLMGLDESNPERKFYEFLVDSQEEFDKHRVDSQKLYTRMPTMLASVTEYYRDKQSKKETFAFASGLIKKRFDSVDFGIVEEDSKGIVGKVPLFYTNEVSLEEGDGGSVPIDSISFDLATIAAANAWNSIRHREMTRIVVEMEALRSILAKRETHSRNARGDKNFKRSGDPVEQDGDKTNILNLFNNFLEKEIYGQFKKDEKILGVEVSYWDTLLRYNSLLLLGGNFKNALVNTAQGMSSMFIESGASAMISRESFKKARQLYGRDLWNGSILHDIGTYKRTSLSNLLSDHFNALNDIFGSRNNYSHVTARQRVSRDSSTWFGMISGPEHMIHITGMYAVLNDIYAQNENGEYINAEGEVVKRKDALRLSEAYSKTENNELQLNEHVKKMEFLGVSGLELNAHNLHLIQQRINGVNGLLHGYYSEQNKSEAYRWWLSRALMQMRGWLIPGYDRRFRGMTNVFSGEWKNAESEVTYSYELSQSFEGNYASTYRLLVRMLKDIGSIKALLSGDQWHSLTDHQKDNVVRTAIEAGVITITIGLGNALLALAEGLGGDDELEGNLALTGAYVMFRLKSELSLYMNPTEYRKLIADPAALMVVYDRIYKLLYESIWKVGRWDRYERGRNKGEYKVQKAFRDMVPLWTNVEDFKKMEDLIEYYQ